MVSFFVLLVMLLLLMGSKVGQKKLVVEILAL